MAFDSKSAVFTGVETQVTVTWTSAFVATTYRVVAGVTIPSGSAIGYRLKTKTTTQITVEPTALFTGQIDLFAFDGS